MVCGAQSSVLATFCNEMRTRVVIRILPSPQCLMCPHTHIEPRCLFRVPALLDIFYFSKCCVAAAVVGEQNAPKQFQLHLRRMQENCEPLPLNCFAVRLTPRPRNIEGTDSARQFQKVRSRSSRPWPNKMHQPGIEPGSHRWQRCILPLDH